MKNRNNQQGQMLPLGLLLVSVVTIATLVLFNTGQSTTDKIRLANAADAAAYSGALWQARALNFQAYTNRAMVANQVSMGQAIALQSWALYGAVASENLATVLKPIPVINVISAGVESGFTAINQVIAPMVKALLPMVSTVNLGLSKAQAAVHASTVIATSDVIDTIVQGHDKRFSVRTGFNAKAMSDNLQAWQGFTTRIDRHNVARMQGRQAMINASLDEFSRQRNWEFFNFWFYSRPFLRHKLIRRGATRLNSVHTPTGMQWRWQSEDTVSLHNKISRIGGAKRVEIPIGWANVNADSHSNAGNALSGKPYCEADTDPHCESLRHDNEVASGWAEQGVPSAAKALQTNRFVTGYSGLNTYRSLSQNAIQQADPRLALKLEVSMPADQGRSAETVGVKISSGLPIVAAGNHLSTLSAAEVFYQRPDQERSTIATTSTTTSTTPSATLERAHGYSPYWQARLVPVSDEERKLALALRVALPGTKAASYDDASAVADDQGMQRYRPTVSAFESTIQSHRQLSTYTPSNSLALEYRALQSAAAMTLDEVNDAEYQARFEQVLNEADAINRSRSIKINQDQSRSINQD